ncbi:hypothetical protein ACWCY6_17800 [Streptomyces sp. 900105755]
MTGTEDRQPGDAQAAVDSTEDQRRRVQQRFIETLLANGNAVPEGEQVPDEATHELRREADGTLVAERRHFSAF